MPFLRGPEVTRRTLLLAGGAMTTAATLPAWARRVAADAPAEIRLVAAPRRLPLVGPPHPDTAVWCYGGTVPGPEIRLRQGERLRVRVDNRLDQDTTIHWHGLRVPNAMDGVPHLTQKPIAPGASFVYDFRAPDAGTYWYHPHQRSFEQVGRGLAGALIVEESEPITVDRDVVWVLDDWRLLNDASISDDFGNLHDVSHNGRVGNTVTLNGRLPERFVVRAGERVRLRLINAANARIFGLGFDGHRPRVVALDGQPVEPHEPANRRVVLGPGMRADLVIDMEGEPGERFAVVDDFYRGLEYWLLDLAYEDRPPLRMHPLDASVRLPANPLAEPDLRAAERHEVVFTGGMMGGMGMGRSMADMRAMMRSGLVWALNGVAASDHVMDPMARLRLGRSYVMDMRNETAWHHPMHLHGHAFRVLSRNGEPAVRREWQDTVLVSPRERVEIAFVADNPGDWMFHCHVLEHQAGGMMGIVRVV